MRRPLAASFVCALAVTALASCSAGASRSPPKATPSGTKQAPKLSAGHHATVTYCNGERARIAEPSTLHGPAPAAVYVHGGALVSGNYGAGGFLINTIGPNLAAQGLVVVSVDYRLGPKALWPDQIVDVKCAIRYLRANTTQLNIDPNAIGAWGQSAGATWWPCSALPAPDRVGTSGPTPTSRAGSRPLWTWPVRAICSPLATRARAVS